MPLSSKQMESVPFSLLSSSSLHVLTSTSRYLALAWQCFESEPKIDYEKFRTVAGLKTAASARELMRVTKNKLKEEYGALQSGMQDANTNGTPKKHVISSNGTPASTASKKRSRGKKAAAEGKDEDDAEETPLKKKKGCLIKKEVKEDDAAEESEG